VKIGPGEAMMALVEGRFLGRSYGVNGFFIPELDDFKPASQ
jgi:hypothetical protein